MPKTIDLTDGTVASHFEGSDQIWECRDNNFLVGYGILGFYRKFGGDALCGLSYLGLPCSNEKAVVGHPGVVVQEFERGCVCYDPKHSTDFPPGAGDCYLVHVDRDPRAVALQAEIAALQPEATAQKLAALQAKIVQVVKEIEALIQ